MEAAGGSHAARFPGQLPPGTCPPAQRPHPPPQLPLTGLDEDTATGEQHRAIDVLPRRASPRRRRHSMAPPADTQPGPRAPRSPAAAHAARPSFLHSNQGHGQSGHNGDADPRPHPHAGGPGSGPGRGIDRLHPAVRAPSAPLRDEQMPIDRHLAPRNATERRAFYQGVLQSWDTCLPACSEARRSKPQRESEEPEAMTQLRHGHHPRTWPDRRECRLSQAR